MALPSRTSPQTVWPGLEDIQAAAERIRNVTIRTPLIFSDTLSFPGASVRLKLECLQPTGSFKVRGAFNAIFELDDDALKAGVVSASTGNHGRAVAYAAKQTGTHAVICLSELVPQNKVEAIRSLGAEICVVGRSQDDAQKEVARLVESRGLTEIPPFDHRSVIAGQGTIGLEILEEYSDVDTIVVPLSGGGLISGIAAAVKAVKPAVRMIGVSMTRGAAMAQSLKSSHPVDVEELPTLADSLGGGIGLQNRYTFSMTRDLVDDIVLIDEDAISEAMRHLLLAEGLVVEGAGAVGIGAVRERLLGDARNIALIVSGRNVDADTLLTVLNARI